MGLENGIYVRNLNRNSLIGKMFRYPFSADIDDSNIICYWRKCWNIRHAVLEILNKPRNSYDGDYRLTRKDVLKIKKGIQTILDTPSLWCDSIWEFDEIEGALKCDVRDLSILSLLMKFKDLDVYFYDSY